MTLEVFVSDFVVVTVAFSATLAFDVDLVSERKCNYEQKNKNVDPKYNVKFEKLYSIKYYNSQPVQVGAAGDKIHCLLASQYFVPRDIMSHTSAHSLPTHKSFVTARK